MAGNEPDHGLAGDTGAHIEVVCVLLLTEAQNSFRHASQKISCCRFESVLEQTSVDFLDLSSW